jgi:hypothetical protein
MVHISEVIKSLDIARISYLKKNPFCSECDRQGYLTLARCVDFESGQTLCLRCFGDLMRARDEAAGNVHG